MEDLPFEEVILIEAFPVWMLTFIVGMALADAISVIGFVQAFVICEPALFTPFAFLSALIFLKKFPTMDTFVTEVKKMRRLFNR